MVALDRWIDTSPSPTGKEDEQLHDEGEDGTQARAGTVDCSSFKICKTQQPDGQQVHLLHGVLARFDLVMAVQVQNVAELC